MSLVLEALRRVEKPGARPGSIGVAVASFRPPRRRTPSVLPLVLGLGTGGLFVYLWGPPFRETALTDISPLSLAAAEPLVPLRPIRGRAGLPPMRLPENVKPASHESGSSENVPGIESGSVERRRRARPPATESFLPAVLRPALVLQAIGERDGRPIAVINDRLVREGDVMNGARIIRIGSDHVEVLGADQRPSTVHFAPPPEPEPTPIPESH